MKGNHMATAALILVGSEMVDPSRKDSNGPYACTRLQDLAIPVVYLARVEDRIPSIAEALKTALALCDVVITSGGLGPTGDDLTREGAAMLLGTVVREDEQWIRTLEERLSSRGRTLSAAGRRQALIVDGGEAIPNGNGLACGCWLRPEGKSLVLLPGVPSEFRSMLDAEVLPRLRDLHPHQPRVASVKAVAAGIPEADAEATLAPWYGKPGLDVSILPHLGVLQITFTLASPPIDDPKELTDEIRRHLAEGLDDHLVSLDGTSLEESLGRLLLEKGLTMAAAESCTGGLIGHRIVSVPGASRYFLGEIVAYDNGAKETLLGVPPGVIERHGAVSEETALAMVRGARARFGASCAVATTGVAGPSGGTAEKPAGTVWVAWGTRRGEKARRLYYPLDRCSVMELAVNYALFSLWRELKSEP
jgi:nicotinamide-nucleotide amidase